jgi:molybdate transport system substrate-binding protein
VQQSSTCAVVLALSALGHLAAAPRHVSGEVLVAAAASLSALAPALSNAIRDETRIEPRFNFAGSNTLARQIVEGARVDVFISADESQMDLVEQAGRVVAGSRVNLLSNQLVVIVPQASRVPVSSAVDLNGASIRRLAMGDPRAVPAGVYGRRWLEAGRLWGSVAAKVVPLSSSPSVVAAVREGRADAGVVYLTDARGEPGVRVAYTVPIGEAPPIAYPIAAITGGRVADARLVIAWLASASARRLFEAAGFRVPASR